MYKRKYKSNIINHKEFVSYIGNVETFRILVFAKAVKLKYWEYKKTTKELKKYQNIEIPSTVCNLSTYLENNKDKIDYTTYEHNGWFIGSGAIESSNKTVVQLRLKQAGMRWSVNGANYIITLRCMVESDNWDKVEKIVVDYFAH